MNAFWSLVRNDLYFFNKFTTKKWIWFKIYFWAAVLVGFIQYTIFLQKTTIEELRPMRGFWFFLLFYFFLLSARLILKEWDKNTAGWWLSFPHPRIFLLAAKLTAALLRCIKSTLICSMITALMYIEALIFRPDLLATPEIQMEFLTQTARIIGLVVMLTPTIIMFGTITGLLHQSKWKPAAPFFWVLFPAVAMGILKDNFSLDSLKLCGPEILLIIIGQLGIIVLLVLAAKYLIEKQVEG